MSDVRVQCFLVIHCSTMLMAAMFSSEINGLSKDFWRPELKEVIDKLLKSPSMAVETLAPLISEGKATVSQAFCLRHQKKCKLRTARRHIAGTSCVGYSRKGTGLLCEDSSVIHTLSWISQRLCQEPDITSENVKNFPPDLLKRFLFHMYHMDVQVIDAVSFGVPVARERQFVRMRHRAKVIAEISPLSRFCKRFFRACNFSWKELFFMHNHENGGVVAKESELNLQWAQKRPTSVSVEKEALDVKHAESFSKALTGAECLDLFRRFVFEAVMFTTALNH